jgi:DNA ligase (NAD+)
MGLPYDTDGVVAILSGLAEYEAAGWSGKYPKGALAYKFETEKAVSYVKCIEFATTRTGAISVVAIIDPTEICGTTVSRLTLNNIFGPGGLIAKDVAVGDKILFEKANEIIPKLVKVLERTRNRDKQIPTSCPACGAPVSRQVLQDGTPGAHLMCTSQKCVARLVKTIAHILEVLQIKGIKEATIESLLGKELIKYPLDIFDLDVESLVKAGCGKRESEIWVKALHGVKATPECLLACMGAPGWGRRMFELLASKSGKPLDFWMEKILNGEKLDIASIVGPVRASILLQELPQGRQLLVGLMKKVGTAHVKAQEGSSLAGKSFCITGTLSKPREQIQADIRASGGIVRDSVSGKLNFLVAGTDCGGKKEKAEKLGVKVITEEELYNMAKG